MPFSLADYLRLRPYSYHVTARENLRLLERTHRIDSCYALLQAAGRLDLLRERRQAYVELQLDGVPVVLKDQKPLVAANTLLGEEWDFGDFVEHLNRHVFFWPGSEAAPISHGRRLLESYAADSPAVLRVPTADLLVSNMEAEPLFCAFNSGAPRYHSGRPAKRGKNLFSPAASFPRRASEVVELVFDGGVVLPTSTSVYGGNGWHPLLSDEAGRNWDSRGSPATHMSVGVHRLR